MTIAVDFDGTIVEHKYPKIGKELPFAIETLKNLQENGHKIILWTVREGDLLKEAVDYCKSRGLEFYAVNSEFPDASWSESGVSRKVKADVYVDDRNVGGIPDWETIHRMISYHINFNDVIESVMSGGSLPEHFDVYNGTFNRPHRHHHKKSIFKRLVEACRRSRSKFRRY